MSDRSLIELSAALEDPRQAWKMLLAWPEVLLLGPCGTLARAEDFVENRRQAPNAPGFLRRLLPFKAEVPTHDTLNDIINAIDGALFAQSFTAWGKDCANGSRTPPCPRSLPSTAKPRDARLIAARAQGVGVGKPRAHRASPTGVRGQV
jgi:hypothetical protein